MEAFSISQKREIGQNPKEKRKKKKNPSSNQISFQFICWFLSLPHPSMWPPRRSRGLLASFQQMTADKGGISVPVYPLLNRRARVLVAPLVLHTHTSLHRRCRPHTFQAVGTPQSGDVVSTLRPSRHPQANCLSLLSRTPFHYKPPSPTPSEPIFSKQISAGHIGL